MYGSGIFLISGSTAYFLKPSIKKYRFSFTEYSSSNVISKKIATSKRLRPRKLLNFRCVFRVPVITDNRTRRCRRRCGGRCGCRSTYAYVSVTYVSVTYVSRMSRMRGTMFICVIIFSCCHNISKIALCYQSG